MKIVGVREGGLGNRETGEVKYILSSMIKSQNLRVFFAYLHETEIIFKNTLAYKLVAQMGKNHEEIS